jgi:hypothetical protein
MADARKLFTQGSELYLAHKYDEALDALRKSYELVPSPNSGLIIARCLKELGQPVEAAEMYANVEADARKRVGEGDTKYQKALEAAVTEGMQVRNSLGSLRVRVRNAPPGTKLEIAGAQRPLTGDEVEIPRAPGETSVRVIPPDGAVQGTSVTIVAGTQSRVEFDLRSSTGPHTSTGLPIKSPDKASSAPAGSERPWAMPAAWVATGFSALGFGAFIGFGLASQAKYNDLNNRCGPAGCGLADRADADTGKRYQTLANGGIILGSVAAAAAVTFFVLAATAGTTSEPEKKQSRLIPGGFVW